MASLNKWLGIGNLTHDPETRPVGDTSVCRMRLAVNESYTNKGGEKVEKALFLDVEAWGAQAGPCQNFLRRGSPVFIEGRLVEDAWEDKETGQKRTRMKVRADRVQFLAVRKGEDGGAEQADPAQAQRPTAKDDEHIPF